MTERRSPPAHQTNLAEGPAGLAAKVSFLMQPRPYPDAPDRVEAIETHMSWVFLTRLYAWKLKKPVHYDFLDFRSLEARRLNCEEEVRLNRRLAPKIYIGTVPLTADAAGQLQLGGDGAAVDWLVQMHRLPADRMLDRAIEAGTVQAGEIAQVARLLAQFYSSAAPEPVTPSAYRSGITASLATNRDDLLDPDFGLPGDAVRTVAGRILRFLTAQAALFDRRVQQGRIVEGHGDLRPEHIFLGPNPAVIDCLEFNRDFRILDPVDELAFLAMECAQLGAGGIGDGILEACCRELDDRPPAELVTFFKAHRAMLRARLAILHLRDPGITESRRWRTRALAYLDLAVAYSGSLG